MSVPLTAWPFGEVDSTEAQFAALFAALQDDGLSGAPGSSNAQVTPASGMSVNVAAFPFAYLSGGVATLAAPTTLALDPPSAQARIDRVVIRMDWTADTAQLDVLKGVPGAGTAPALTRTPGGVYELGLARVAVAPAALNIATSNITDERTFVSDRVHRWTDATRPAATIGLLGFNFTSKKFEYSVDGTTWTALAAEQPNPTKIFHQRVTITPTGSYPQRTRFAVSFGGLFANRPEITVSPTTGYPDNVSVSYGDDTASGCNVVLSRDDGNIPTGVSVIAVGT